MATEALGAFQQAIEKQTESADKSLEATEKQTQLLRSAQERIELNSRVRVFRGDPEEDFGEFIEEFEIFCNQQSDDSQARRAASLPGRLSGEAAYSYRALPDATKGNYSELVKALQAHFTSPRYKLKQQALLANRKQNLEESPAKYASVLRTIFRNVFKGNQAFLNLEDQLLTNKFMLGLREEHR